MSKRRKRGRKRPRPTKRHRTRFPHMMLFALTLVVVALVLATKGNDPVEPVMPSSSVARSEPSELLLPSDLPSEEVILATIAKLKRLIETHPKVEIRENLSRWIDSNQVYMNYQSSPKDRHCASVGVIRLPEEGNRLVPVLQVNTSSILSPRRDDQFHQMVLWHEYQHLLQLQSGAARFEGFLILPAEMMAEIWTLELAEEWFNNEIDAHIAGCDFANEIGRPNLFFLCQEYNRGGTRALRHSFAKEASRLPWVQKVGYQDVVLRLGEK